MSFLELVLNQITLFFNLTRSVLHTTGISPHSVFPSVQFKLGYAHFSVGIWKGATSPPTQKFPIVSTQALSPPPGRDLTGHNDESLRQGGKDKVGSQYSWFQAQKELPLQEPCPENFWSQLHALLLLVGFWPTLVSAELLGTRESKLMSHEPLLFSPIGILGLDSSK